MGEKKTTSKLRAVSVEELDSATLFSEKKPTRVPSVASEIEDLQEQAIELRLKLVAALETQIANGQMDPTEAVQRFASIVTPHLTKTAAYDAARTYLLNLGHTQLWSKAL